MSLIEYTPMEDDTLAKANEWNSRYADIIAVVNGGIDAANIKKGSLTRDLFSTDANTGAWPVGSVFLSINNANPSTSIGGSWVRFGEGRMLVGVSSSDTDFNESEKTGGAKTVALTAAQNGRHSHTGNTSSNGQHTHGLNRDVAYTDNSTRRTGPGNAQQAFGFGGVSISAAGNHNHSFTTNESGTGEAHNNMSPYITVYMWKRTA